jgi:hypothetical protein
VSVATANLLSGAGKEHWVTRREEMVVAKGKGAVVTYWLVTKTKRGKAAFVSSGQSTSDAQIEGSKRTSVSSGQSTPDAQIEGSLEKSLP